MRWYFVHQALREARLSRFEQHLLLAGFVLMVLGVVAGHAFGAAGLGFVLGCAVSRAARMYREASCASLATSVARVHVRARPRGVYTAVTVGLALGLPLVAAVAVVVLLAWGWLLLAGVLLLGCVVMFFTWVAETRRGEEPYSKSSETAEELLRRLCMRAGMRPVGLVVAPGPIATAWTARGRIHVTTPLLRLLDAAELEAVLAHELAHLAHRDAAVMEVCSAPSRVLLTFGRSVARLLIRCVRCELYVIPGFTWFLSLLTLVVTLCGPPAFVVGWLSRLSVLGISRAREFSADAAAATLTGRPSALASALLKLEHQRERIPRADLRSVEPYAVLCIVGTAGRLFATHPPTAARVKRLEALERRI
jgi:heat shock protein HtpX